jgi:hypothetical protein
MCERYNREYKGRIYQAVVPSCKLERRSLSSGMVADGRTGSGSWGQEGRFGLEQSTELPPRPADEPRLTAPRTFPVAVQRPGARCVFVGCLMWRGPARGVTEMVGQLDRVSCGLVIADQRHRRADRLDSAASW